MVFFNRYAQCLLVISVLSMNTVIGQTNDLKADPANSQQVTRGQWLYQRFCSLCHGKNLQGEANWRQRKANGKLPAPPHDETGHTWHHPDEVLFGITKYGLVPPYAPKDYQSDMPGWEGTLSDPDIWAILAFIKSRWSKNKQVYQQTVK